MKKVLRILLIALGVLLLLLITVPLLFRSRIESFVKEQINKQVHATVDWSGIGISLFRGFPDLSVNLRAFSVVGLEPFEGDTLAGMDRFEVRVDLFSAIRKDVEVKAVILDRPVINAVVLEDGSASWDIARKPEGGAKEKGESQEEAKKSMISAAETQEKSTEDKAEKTDVTTESKPATAAEKEEIPVKIQLNRLAIMDGRIRYEDAESEMEAMLQDLDLELSGDFSMDQTDLVLELAAEGVQAKVGGIRYLKDAVFGLDLTAAADLVNNVYTLKENEIRLNELVLGTEGVVSLLEDGAMEMDLHFFSRETSFGSLLSMVPAIYLNEFGSLKTSGSLQLEGDVKGTMKDTILPAATLALVVHDGYFSYPDLPKDVSDVQIELQADYRGTDMDLSTLDLKKFHFLMGGNPFDIVLHVAHPVSDMQVDGTAMGIIDFSTLREVVPLEELELGGRLETDLRWNTRLSFIENEQYEKVDLEGKLVMQDVLLSTPEIPVPVHMDRMEMEFTPRVVNLLEMDLTAGASDLQMEGTLSNFIPYLFTGQTISGSLNVRSGLLDVNELLPETAVDTSRIQPAEQQAAKGASETETSADQDTQPEKAPPAEPDTAATGVPAEPEAEPSAFRIPENIDFHMNLDLKKVIYQDIEVENIHGAMRVMEGTARLDGLDLDVLEGNVRTSGTVDTRGEYADADLVLDIKGVDIPSAYETFVTVERLAPMAGYCRGTANVEMNYRSLLDATFTPLFSTINAKGKLFTKGLQVYNLKSFVRLSEILKNEKFRNMAPDEVDLRFTVLNGRVMVDPFDIDFDNSRITASGSHGIDRTMDYQLDMSIAKSDLGEGAAQMMQGLSALAAGAGLQIPQSDVIKVKAWIRGTFGDPEITTDLRDNFRSGGETVKKDVEEQVREKLDQVEADVREEAGEKANQIISDAEREADRIMEEAREAGDELVKEAEQQGERLVKEAGNNPLKKAAARRAADELRGQAVKQSDHMIREAEERADRILENARKEAEKL